MTLRSSFERLYGELRSMRSQYSECDTLATYLEKEIAFRRALRNREITSGDEASDFSLMMHGLQECKETEYSTICEKIRQAGSNPVLVFHHCKTNDTRRSSSDVKPFTPERFTEYWCARPTGTIRFDFMNGECFMDALVHVHVNFMGAVSVNRGGVNITQSTETPLWVYEREMPQDLDPTTEVMMVHILTTENVFRTVTMEAYTSYDAIKNYLDPTFAQLLVNTIEMTETLDRMRQELDRNYEIEKAALDGQLKEFEGLIDLRDLRVCPEIRKRFPQKIGTLR